ncbi:3',5'-cyclic adenosine monophosphate phosphodiesterase CpdA [Planotetraspora thailandica]|uniref:3',5'-cyclic adenosine monophosphate phosphodiesterase CpdA n=1 Tax=Planotetraspora thailandica TaxID=487172 RepID=A0A8J3UYX5_9ACTN|nr:metallophosphoesterase [Planotetraspora thailandica]GII54418.1 3',5'-cyclic adenosine monophosphate phosphodiesterase CpdA [Planotetraspora thailandica]
MLVIAHLSDTHIDDHPRSAERTARVMDYLNALPRPVDAILITGDIADHGEVTEYETAAKLFDSPSPVMVCPGNHDVRAAYRKGLLGDDSGGTGPINARYDVAGAVFLLADSSIPGQDDGRLDAETLNWLGGELDSLAPGTPAFIAFHHPPIALHHPVVDPIRLLPAEPLAELVAAHPQAVAVLTGHFHTAAASTFAGRPLRIAPGVVSTLRMPWEGEGRLATQEQPPGVAFHVYDDTGLLTTHYRVVV